MENDNSEKTINKDKNIKIDNYDKIDSSAHKKSELRKPKSIDSLRVGSLKISNNKSTTKKISNNADKLNNSNISKSKYFILVGVLVLVGVSLFLYNNYKKKSVICDGNEITTNCVDPQQNGDEEAPTSTKDKIMQDIESLDSEIQSLDSDLEVDVYSDESLGL